MSFVFTKYYHIAKMNFINSLAYSADFLAKALFISMIIFIFTGVWRAIYSTIPLGGAIEGFTIVMVMWYFLATESIVTAQDRVADEIGSEIKSGDIANQLNKPYNYILQKYASCIGNATFRVILTFTIGAIVVFSVVGGFKINPVAIPAFALCVFLAITLQFTILAFLGIFAFWFEEVRSFEFIYQKIVFTLGGMFLPLEFFPAWLGKISAMLPFGYVAYYPAKTLVSFNTQAFIHTVLIQLVWIAFFAGLITIIYSFAIKKVSVNGG